MAAGAPGACLADPGAPCPPLPPACRQVPHRRRDGRGRRVHVGGPLRLLPSRGPPARQRQQEAWQRLGQPRPAHPGARRRRHPHLPGQRGAAAGGQPRLCRRPLRRQLRLALPQPAGGLVDRALCAGARGSHLCRCRRQLRRWRQRWARRRAWCWHRWQRQQAQPRWRHL